MLAPPRQVAAQEEEVNDDSDTDPIAAYGDRLLDKATDNTQTEVGKASFEDLLGEQFAAQAEIQAAAQLGPHQRKELHNESPHAIRGGCSPDKAEVAEILGVEERLSANTADCTALVDGGHIAPSELMEERVQSGRYRRRLMRCCVGTGPELHVHRHSRPAGGAVHA